MKFSDLFEETYLALLVNKVRSGLTVLGIVIGIGSVIALLSIGQGAQSAIQANINSLGANLLIVEPGFPQNAGVVRAGRGAATTLVQADVDAINNQVTGVAAVAPEYDAREQVTVAGQNTNTEVIGTTAEYAQVRNVTVDDGSFFTDSDVTNMSRVAVIGPTTATDLFGAGVEPVGQTIVIKGIQFQIIGVTVSKGSSGVTNQDDDIIVPLSDMQHLLSGTTYFSTISVEAASQQVMTSVQSQITSVLLQDHNIADPADADFSVLNQSSIVSAASAVTNTFTVLLAAVASISLIVGGIGIMNMMLTTVTERTREIGLRKAIGAKRGDINSQFLAEAIMLTFFGGFVGVILGISTSLLVTQFAGVATTISVSSILMAFGVSALIGILFGYYPARRASRLNPIEALRYE